jgi:hypothetical protein
MREGSRGLPADQLAAEPLDQLAVGGDHVPGDGPAQRPGGGQGVGQGRVAAGEVDLPGPEAPLELLGRRGRPARRLYPERCAVWARGVADQQAQHHHLPLRAAEAGHRRDGAARRGPRPLRPGDPARPSPLGDGVAGHRDQPGAGLDLASGGRRQPAERVAEDLPGQVRRLRLVAGPGQQVAVDALDLVVVEPRERLPVAAGGAFEQGTLARHLGGHVAVPAGAGDPLGVRRTRGPGCQGPSAAEQELHRGREHDDDEQGGHDDGGPGSHAAADSTRSACSRERAAGPRPWPAGSWRCRGSRAAPRAGRAGRRPRCGRPARG